MRRVFDLNDFGAVGDGIFDNTLAIQFALNRARDAGGGRIVCSEPGVYMVSDAFKDNSDPEYAINRALNAAMVVSDRTTIELDENVEIRMTPHTPTTMLRNYRSGRSDTTNNEDIAIIGGRWNLGAEAAFVYGGTTSGSNVVLAGAFANYTFMSGDVFRAVKTDYTTEQIAVVRKIDNDTIELASAATGTNGVVGAVCRQTQVVPVHHYVSMASTNGAGTTMTATNRFNGYTYTAGDVFVGTLSNGNAVTASVSSKTDNSNIVLATSIGANETGVSGVIYKASDPTRNLTNLYLGHTMLFKNVDGLRVQWCNFFDSLKFGVVVANATEFRTQGLRFRHRIQGADGIHVCGGCDNFTLRDTRGITYDNLIGLISSEGSYSGGWYTYELAEGNITNGLVDDSYCVDSYEPVRLAGSTGHSLNRIVVRGVHGTVRAGGAVKLLDDSAYGIVGATMERIAIEDVDARIRKFVNTQSAGNSTPPVIIQASGATDVYIKNLTVDIVQGTGVNDTCNNGSYGVWVTSASTSMKRLTIDGIGVVGTFSGSGINGLVHVSASVPCLQINNPVAALGGNGALLVTENAITVRANITGANLNLVSNSGATYFYVRTNSTLDLNLSGSTFDGLRADAANRAATFIRTDGTLRLNIGGGVTISNMLTVLNQEANSRLTITGCAPNYSGTNTTLVATALGAQITSFNVGWRMDGDLTNLGLQTTVGQTFYQSTSGGGTFGTLNVGPVIRSNAPAWERHGRTA